MNAKMKRRLILVSIMIVAVVASALVFVSGFGAAQSVSVSQAASGDFAHKHIKVSGTVVDNSFYTEGDMLIFRISDSASSDTQTPSIEVHYAGSASSTFGNGINAICTGEMKEDGVLVASELITKCPSKYEDESTVVSNSEGMRR